MAKDLDIELRKVKNSTKGAFELQSLKQPQQHVQVETIFTRRRQTTNEAQQKPTKPHNGQGPLGGGKGPCTSNKKSTDDDYGNDDDDDEQQCPHIFTSFLDETHRDLRGKFNYLRAQASKFYCEHVEDCNRIDCNCPRGIEKISSNKVGGKTCDYEQEMIIERSFMTDQGLQTTIKHIIKRCDKNGHIEIEVEEIKPNGINENMQNTENTASEETLVDIVKMNQPSTSVRLGGAGSGACSECGGRGMLRRSVSCDIVPSHELLSCYPSICTYCANYVAQKITRNPAQSSMSSVTLGRSANCLPTYSTCSCSEQGSSYVGETSSQPWQCDMRSCSYSKLTPNISHKRCTADQHGSGPFQDQAKDCKQRYQQDDCKQKTRNSDPCSRGTGLKRCKAQGQVPRTQPDPCSPSQAFARSHKQQSRSHTQCPEDPCNQRIRNSDRCSKATKPKCSKVEGTRNKPAQFCQDQATARRKSEQCQCTCNQQMSNTKQFSQNTGGSKQCKPKTPAQFCQDQATARRNSKEYQCKCNQQMCNTKQFSQNTGSKQCKPKAYVPLRPSVQFCQNQATARRKPEQCQCKCNQQKISNAKQFSQNTGSKQCKPKACVPPRPSVQFKCQDQATARCYDLQKKNCEQCQCTCRQEMPYTDTVTNQCKPKASECQPKLNPQMINLTDVLKFYIKRQLCNIAKTAQRRKKPWCGVRSYVGTYCGGNCNSSPPPFTKDKKSRHRRTECCKCSCCLPC